MDGFIIACEVSKAICREGKIVGYDKPYIEYVRDIKRGHAILNMREFAKVFQDKDEVDNAVKALSKTLTNVKIECKVEEV